MLPPENRLKKVRDFNLLMKYGRWVNGRFLDLKVLELGKATSVFPKKVNSAEFADQLLVAFTVGLKIDKRAVVRNRLRRQMRETVRLLVKDNAIKKGFYILLVAKKDIIGKDYDEIKDEVKTVLKRAGLFL